MADTINVKPIGTLVNFRLLFEKVKKSKRLVEVYFKKKNLFIKTYLFLRSLDITASVLFC